MNQTKRTQDLRLVGKWKFEEDKNVKPQKPNPKPQQKPQQKPLKPLKPQKPKVKVQKGRMLPKTNVESAFSYVLLALAGIGGAYIAKKKDNEQNRNITKRLGKPSLFCVKILKNT